MTDLFLWLLVPTLIVTIPLALWAGVWGGISWWWVIGGAVATPVAMIVAVVVILWIGGVGPQ